MKFQVYLVFRTFKILIINDMQVTKVHQFWIWLTAEDTSYLATCLYIYQVGKRVVFSAKCRRLWVSPIWLLDLFARCQDHGFTCGEATGVLLWPALSRLSLFACCYVLSNVVTSFFSIIKLIVKTIPSIQFYWFTWNLC